MWNGFQYREQFMWNDTKNEVFFFNLNMIRNDWWVLCIQTHWEWKEASMYGMESNIKSNWCGMIFMNSFNGNHAI